MAGSTVSRPLLAVLSCLLLAACPERPTPKPSAEAPDTIFTGDFITLDASRPRVQALAVRNGRIVAAGARDEVQALAGAGTRTVAIVGVAVPGWADAHVHDADTRGQIIPGEPINLRGMTKSRILESVAALARAAKPDETIVGEGWDEGFFDPPVFPTAADLDAVSGDHPVVLSRIDGHSSWVNSLVLERSHITRATEDPAGGRVLRNAVGDPTGILVDRAQALIVRAETDGKGDAGDAADRARATLQQYARLGYTSIHPAGVSLGTIAAYKQLLAGGLPVRVYAMARGDEAVRHYLARGPEPDLGDGQLAVRSFKFLIDGALGSRGALLAAPYADAPREHGLSMMTDAELEGIVRDARAKGFQLNVHAIGDRAVSRVLDAFERGGVTPADRFRIEHASMVAPADIPRFARLGVIASMQPVFLGEYSRWAEDRLGPARMRSVLPVRDLLAAGAVVACGTDYGASDSGDPIRTLSALVAGRSADGTPGGAWYMPQRVDVDAALRCMSTAPAFAAFQEHDLGALTVGRYADFTVLSADPYKVLPDELQNVAVRMTVMAGRVTHDDGGRALARNQAGRAPAGARGEYTLRVNP
ncbi:MAG: amidohydrolase [Vicinamibacterales bacterium]